jgi:hypothetical protein
MNDSFISHLDLLWALMSNNTLCLDLFKGSAEGISSILLVHVGHFPDMLIILQYLLILESLKSRLKPALL